MSFRVPVGYNPHDLPGQIVDEGTLGRIVDPISGASFLNPNSDPNETGIDPVTGEDYIAGTDQGFGLMAYDALLTGLYNAQFSVGPPEGADSQIEETYNEIPYWRYVQDDSGHIRASWVVDTDAPGGHSVQFTSTGGASGDEAYFEQIVPVSPHAWRTAAPVLVVDDGDEDVYLQAQHLDSDGVEVGDSAEEKQFAPLYGSATRLVAPLAVPANARYLRVRFGYRYRASEATRLVREVYAGRPRIIYATVPFSAIQVNPGGTQPIYTASGNVLGELDNGANRYVPPFGGWVDAISVRSHTEPSAGSCTYRVVDEDNSRTFGPTATITSSPQRRYASASSNFHATDNYFRHYGVSVGGTGSLRVVAGATSNFSNGGLDSLVFVTFALIDNRD